MKVDYLSVNFGQDVIIDNQTSSGRCVGPERSVCGVQSDEYSGSFGEADFRVKHISWGGLQFVHHELSVRSPFDFEVSHGGAEPQVIFNLLRSGELYLPTPEVRGLWHGGQMNMSFVPADAECKWSFLRSGVVSHDAIVMSLPFVEEMMNRYPVEFGLMGEHLRRGDYRKAKEENLSMDVGALRLSSDLLGSVVLGNAACGYAQSRILDYMSPFIYRMSGVEGRYNHRFSVRNKMHDARAVVEESIGNPPSLPELAALVGTNECTLKRAFKEEFGMTVYAYIFSRRMELAAAMLRDPALTMSDVALSLGYDHMSHFSSAFKKFYGVPPSLFRRSGGR